MSSNIGFIETLPIRRVWPKEDADFTPWLQKNIGELDKVLRLGLTDPQREVGAGDFSIDLVAGTDVGDVVIENQFGRSDHRHLGQLVTYLSDRDVQRAIWILEDARPEHIKAVQTLNARGLGQIWMVTVRAIKIVGPGSDRGPALGDSTAAPLFTIVAEPSDIENFADDAGTTLKPSQIKRRAFMAALFEQARAEEIDSPFKDFAPSVHGMLTRPARGPGLLYRVAVNRKESRVVLTNAGGMWEGALAALREHRQEIDRNFENDKLPGKLQWFEQINDQGRWVIRYTVDVNYQDDPPDPAKLRELNRASAEMRRVFQPYLDELDESLEDGDDSESAGG